MTAMTLSARVVRDHGSALRQGQRTRNYLRSAAWLLVLMLGAANAQASSVAAGAIFVHGFEAPAGPIAPGDLSIEIASHWGGPIRGGDVQGDYAYIANGRMFRVLDISDETNPVEVAALKLGAGTSVHGPGGVYDVKVRGDYAFVGGDSQHFFNVVDVSDPTAPSLVRSFAGGSHFTYAAQIELNENHAYVLEKTSNGTGDSIRIYRIDDPANPISSSSLSTVSLLTSIAIGNGHLFVGLFYGSANTILRVYDLSNPLNPAPIGSLAVPGFTETRDLLVVGDHLYATARVNPSEGIRYGLLTVDISDPTAPFLTDEQVDFGFYEHERQLAVSDGRLYAIDQHPEPRGWGASKGLYIYDIAQAPEAPVLLNTYRPDHGVYGTVLSAAPGRVYVWDKAEGFVIMDVADPSFLRPLGKYHSPGELRKMVADGSRLYVSDAWGGFTVLDVADTSRPRVLGRYLAKRHDTAGINASGIVKVDDIVYLAGTFGLLTVDVSDPARPHTLGAMRISSMAFPSNPWCGAAFQGLKVRDQVAYLGYMAHFCSSRAMYLLAVDVTDPFAPEAVGVGAMAHATSAHSIAVGDGIVAASGQMTIHADSPADPQLLHGPMFSHSISSTDVAIHESFRLIVVPEQLGSLPPGTIFGLNIQDIGDPTNPVTISTLTLGESMYALAVQRDSHRVYLRSQQSVLAVDISNPTTPLELYRLTAFQAQADGLTIRRDSLVSLLAEEPNLYATDRLGLTVLNVDGVVPAGAGAAPAQQGN